MKTICIQIAKRISESATLVVAMTLLIAVSSITDTSVAQDKNAPDEVQQRAAHGKLLERQDIIKRLLPKMEAATVCLEVSEGSGSGVIVSKDGLILTASHVVIGDEMKVRFMDGRVLTAKALGKYNPADAAMMQIVDDGPFDFVPIAPKGSLSIGQTVLAVGHAGGFDQQRGMPLRIGHIVSMKDGLYATDAPLIGGDSGGPSFNLDGQVIGIHSNIDTRLAGINNDSKIDSFVDNWDSMLRGEVRGGKLLDPEFNEEPLVFGLTVFSSQSGDPIRIQSVTPDSPAAWAGLQAEDRIVIANGNQVASTSAEFMKNALTSEFGRELTLKVKRGGGQAEEELELKVCLLTRREVKAESERRASEKQAEPKADDEDGARNDLESSIDLVAGFATTRELTGIEFIAAPNPKQQQSTQIQQATEPIEQDQQPTVEPQQPDQNDDEPKTELQKLLEESRRNNGRLRIDREKLRSLRNQLNSRIDQTAPSSGRRLDAWGKEFRTAFVDSVKKYSVSTFPVRVSARQVGLGLLVNKNGYMLCKASDVEGRKIEVAFDDDSRGEAVLAEIDPELDLALIKVDPSQLPENAVVVDLTQYSPSGVKGTLCCSIGHDASNPAGFGVVSVSARALNGNTSAFLGAVCKTNEDSASVVINKIGSASPAELAGLKAGDIIETIKMPSGESITLRTAEELDEAVKTRLPDDRVKFNIRRGDRWLTLPVTLGDKSKVIIMPGAREQAADTTSTKISRRRWNFTTGIQHDCGIQPKDCGGVLVDLDGNIIGINIARAARIRSFAIPVDTATEFVKNAIDGLSSEGTDK